MTQPVCHSTYVQKKDIIPTVPQIQKKLSFKFAYLLFYNKMDSRD